MAFKALNLSESVLRGVQAAGYTDPTPIQLRAIPVVLGGGDLIASAQTGTGKTAAFALPILSKLGVHRRGGNARVLVLEPTRELAAQVETAFRGAETRRRHHRCDAGPFDGLSQGRHDLAP
jgi:ATP-dependent RNA helicase RhlE